MQGGRSKNLSSFFIHNEYRARERVISRLLRIQRRRKSNVFFPYRFYSVRTCKRNPLAIIP